MRNLASLVGGHRSIAYLKQGAIVRETVVSEFATRDSGDHVQNGHVYLGASPSKKSVTKLRRSAIRTRAVRGSVAFAMWATTVDFSPNVRSAAVHVIGNPRISIGASHRGSVARRAYTCPVPRWS